MTSRPRRLAGLLVAAAALAAIACKPESSVEAAQASEAEGFDFYVISLSWSPTYCALDGADANRQQCAGGREHGFILHGLWPQFESGWPEFCDSSEPERVPDEIVRRHLDIMPSASLIGHQWRKHGTCTGLDQQAYFATARKAFGRVTVPDAFADPRSHVSIDPDAVEAAFLKSNDGLSRRGIAVTCEDGHIDEVRLCVTTDLAFRDCPEVDERSCRISAADMPAP